MSLDRHIVTDQHAKSILTTMNNLRKSNTLCDVTLKVMGETFPAHRIVLAACSDYFCAMFTNEMSEKDKSVVELHDISPDVMQELLDFVYTETVDVSVENVQELLPAACFLQLNGVKEACCAFLEKQLDSSNCLGIKIFAESHNCSALWEAAESYSLHHFEDVVKQDEFKTLPMEEIERLIKSDELQVNNEEPVFEAVMNWVKCNPANRSVGLSTLLSYVRLPLLSAKFITDVVDEESLVKSCHKCRDLLDEAKRFHLRPDLRSQMVSTRTKSRIGTHEALVVLGGFGAQQNLVNAVEKYDPISKEWARLPCLTRRRRYVSASSLDGKLYVIGGYDGQSRLNIVECLDMNCEKMLWVIVTSMNHRRGLAGCCAYKNHIYVCGGFDGYTRHMSMERYNPRTDEWTMLNGMTVGREGAGLVVACDNIYCIGGYDGVNLLDSAEKYDPVTEEWTMIPSMSVQRSGAGVTVLNDIIYVCGGYDGAEHLLSVESYSPALKHWTTLQNMGMPRCYVGACVVRGMLTVVAGYDGNTLLNTVEVYDPSTDTWSVLETCMTTPRCDAGVAVVRML